MCAFPGKEGLPDWLLTAVPTIVFPAEWLPYEKSGWAMTRCANQNLALNDHKFQCWINNCAAVVEHYRRMEFCTYIFCGTFSSPALATSSAHAKPTNRFYKSIIIYFNYEVAGTRLMPAEITSTTLVYSLASLTRSFTHLMSGEFAYDVLKCWISILY